MAFGEKISFLKLQHHRETPKHIKQFIAHLQTRILSREVKICAPSLKVDEIIEARIKGKVYLLNRMIKCGKECTGCPHGPYWYGYYRNKGRFVSFYIGKNLPPRFLNAKKIHIAGRKEGP